jgi:hypothetical protein
MLVPFVETVDADSFPAQEIEYPGHPEPGGESAARGGEDEYASA